MKRFFSICLALLVLLNVMGYYAVFMGLKYQNSQQFVQRLDDDNYSEAETITLKIPLAVPYQSNTEFERVNGEIHHNGEYFRLVKQRFFSDTLQIVCIKDVNIKHINQALSDYVKTFTDNSTENSSKPVPNFIKDYIQTSFDLEMSSDGWVNALAFSSAPFVISSQSLAISSPPPRS